MSTELTNLIKKAIIELGCGTSEQLLLALNLETAMLNEKTNYFKELLDA